MVKDHQYCYEMVKGHQVLWSTGLFLFPFFLTSKSNMVEEKEIKSSCFLCVYLFVSFFLSALCQGGTPQADPAAEMNLSY